MLTFEPVHELGYIHKVHDGKEVYFFANLRKASADSRVNLGGKLTPELWYPYTGEISRPKYSHKKAGSVDITSVRLSLKPTKSIRLIAGTPQ
jgi:hypothetical protein